ncbi:MAG: UMP kinase [Promethearchaeota archaeon]
MKFVLKIGGSLLFDSEQELDLARFNQMASIVQQLKREGHELVIVVGGGVLAKKLVEKGKILGANRNALDRLGIAATWVCAQLMIAALEALAYPTPIMTEEQLMKLQETDKLLVLGGLHPGQSTNAVAARAAEIIGARVLLNVTDVEGVYDKDPKQSPEAKLISELTLDKLRKIVSSLTNEPGSYPLFDKRALEIIERAGVEIWFVNGKDPRNIVHAINNRKIGTRVTIS